jgi:hypothetical protein
MSSLGVLVRKTKEILILGRRRRSRAAAAVPLLANGTYYYQGDAIADGLTPLEGQPWVLDSGNALGDGLVGDQGTGIVTTGVKISILAVHNTMAVAEWALSCRYVDGLSDAYRKWTGVAFAVLTDVNASPWSDHVADTFEDRAADFTGNITQSNATMVVLSFDNAGSDVTDSRLA